MQAGFWSFWSDKAGFDKSAWFEAYLRERAAAPLKPGKTRRNPVSNTRQRLEWIVEEAAPTKCLETNVFSEATETLSELSTEDRGTEVFRFLVESIRPRILLAHGKDAREAIEALAQRTLSEGEPVLCHVAGARTTVLAVPHLSRDWSQDRARSLGRRLRDLADG